MKKYFIFTWISYIIYVLENIVATYEHDNKNGE